MTIRAVLGLGFIVTVGLWLLAGFYFTQRLRDLERQAGDVATRYLQSQELLSTTRSHVYRASIYVRDALLDPLDPYPTAGQYRAEVEHAYKSADGLLAQYVPLLDSPSERERVARLREEIRQLRVAMLEVLSTDDLQWHSDAGTLVRMRIMPRRDAAIRVSEELQALNRSAYVERQAEMAGLYSAAQNRFWQTLTIAIAASLCITLFAAFHVTRLERSLRTQQAKDAQTALDLQRLSAKLVSAQEEERRSIARELHDEVGQILTVIKMELSHAQRKIASGSDSAHLLDDAKAITDRALHAVRDISHLLHPPQLENLGLPAAIDAFVQTIRKREDLDIEFTHRSMAVRLPSDVELAVYRVVQEGLTNVVRHAHAKTCRVTLTRLPDRVVVTVADDGVGIEHAANEGYQNEPGLGLISIRERVAQLSGALRIEGGLGRGTTVTAEFPLRTPAETTVINSVELAATNVG